MKVIPFKKYAAVSFGVFGSLGIMAKAMLMDEPAKTFLGVIPLTLKSAILINCITLFLISLIFYGLIVVWN
ncbi:hypothetical protein OXPF_09940 [Oxobacter pfennigii]|uniref:Uncharacterized protein n=1 Tax=Oxobacter pfennigii TaxID=36849 RepID=A0A0N8NTT9_9CLOT|nr:hypothetical protein [Oxobacter pfennigii]KPU45760.1 hypothetical protein OXPF_09940 [Oxobacter pfennigii]